MLSSALARRLLATTFSRVPQTPTASLARPTFTTIATPIRFATTITTNPTPIEETTDQKPQQRAHEGPFAVGRSTVSDVLRVKGEKYYSTPPDVTVYEAVKQMVSRNIGSLVVVDKSAKDVPHGIITERDYLEKIIVRGRSSKTTNVEEIMSEKKLIAVRPETTLTECMDLMVENRVRHIPVVDEEGKVKGLVSIGDVVKELVNSHKKKAEQMEEYIAGGY